MLSSIVARLATVVAPVLVIPLMLDYLGSALFGLWVTAASVSALAAFADLGLGNGLLTRLSAAAARNDWAIAHQYVATAYAVSVAFCLSLSVFAGLGLYLLDPRILVGNPEGVDPTQVRAVIAICVFAFLVTIPLSLIQRVQYSLQVAWQSNVWQVVGGLSMLALVVIATRSGQPAEVVIACAVLAAPLSLLGNSILFYVRQRPDLRPWGVRLDRVVFRDIFRLGFSFFCLSVLTSVALNIDNLLIANVRGLESVAEYAVAFRLFSMLGFLVTLVALPLWPANSEAIQQGDFEWVERATAKISVCSASVVFVAACVLVAFRSPIFSLWLGEGTTVDLWLAVGLGLSAVILAGASPYFSVQNSVGRLRYQYFGWSAYLVISVALKLLLLERWGVAAVPLVASGAYLAVLVPTAYFGYRCTMRTQRALNRTAGSSS